MAYVIRRVLITIPVLFAITVLVFAIMYLAPGSPLDLLLDPTVTDEQLELQRRALGIDQPFYVQYTRWLMEVLRGNLGWSFASSRPVLEMIWSRLPATLLLSTAATVLAYGLAIPLGVLAGRRPYSAWDYGVLGLAFVTTATPAFFLGLVGIYVFSVRLGWLPVGHMVPPGGQLTVGTLLHHLIMPAMVLAAGQIGGILRYVRSGVLEALHEDYVRTARAKGLSEGRIVFKHVLRNSMIPLVTHFGLSLPLFVGGAIVVEQVFVWPGIGTLMMRAITGRDYPVIMGVTLLVSVAVLLGNLLTDLAYGWLDPRIRYG